MEMRAANQGGPVDASAEDCSIADSRGVERGSVSRADVNRGEAVYGKLANSSKLLLTGQFGVGPNRFVCIF